MCQLQLQQLLLLKADSWLVLAGVLVSVLQQLVFEPFTTGQQQGGVASSGGSWRSMSLMLPGALERAPVDGPCEHEKQRHQGVLQLQLSHAATTAASFNTTAESSEAPAMLLSWHPAGEDLWCRLLHAQQGSVWWSTGTHKLHLELAVS